MQLLGRVSNGRVDALVPVSQIAAVERSLVRSPLVLAFRVGGRLILGHAWCLRRW